VTWQSGKLALPYPPPVNLALGVSSLPAQLISHYRVLGQIGKGGMVVYRGRLPAWLDPWLFKCLQENLASDWPSNERLRREARLGFVTNTETSAHYEVGEDR